VISDLKDDVQALAVHESPITNCKN
jgi:hypothetical protein